MLFVWIGPVTFDQMGVWQILKWAGAPEHAAAGPRYIHAGEAMTLDPGTPLKVRLRDATTVEGRFLGRTVLDSAVYVSRFDSYARASSFVPLTLGETLYVSLRDGREVRAPLLGY